MQDYIDHNDAPQRLVGGYLSDRWSNSEIRFAILQIARQPRNLNKGIKRLNEDQARSEKVSTLKMGKSRQASRSPSLQTNWRKSTIDFACCPNAQRPDQKS